MATDGPDPPPCNQEIFTNGATVFMTNSIPSNAMETWVRLLAVLSGQPVDWHFFCGRAVVKALGNLDEVSRCLEILMPAHDELKRIAVERIFASVGLKPPAALQTAGGQR